MKRSSSCVGRRLGWRVAAVAAAVGIVAPAWATTLRRASLEELVKTNTAVVVGEVLEVKSYWNAEKTFILSDVRVAPRTVIKGASEGEDLTATVLGGTVDGLTSLIVGGAELAPGKTYLLFLGEADLPGAPGVRTVRDHCQGVFDVVKARDGLRAVSQANGQNLVPDQTGSVDVPGGNEGLALPALIDTLRQAASRQGVTR
jgi:hypothetical protein